MSIPTVSIDLPLGLAGLPDERSFDLRPRTPGSAYGWMTSTVSSQLVFAVAEVARLVPDYPEAQVRRNLGFLQLPPTEPLLILALCTVPSAPAPATANLLSPIGIGRESRRGAQIVLHSARWSATHMLPGTTGAGPRTDEPG